MKLKKRTREITHSFRLPPISSPTHPTLFSKMEAPMLSPPPTHSTSEPSPSPSSAPFLIRTFVHPHSFHSVRLFEDRKIPTEAEYQLYGWENSTLVELLDVLMLNLPEKWKQAGLKFAFRFAFPPLFFFCPFNRS